MGDLPKLARSHDVTGKVDDIHFNLTRIGTSQNPSKGQKSVSTPFSARMRSELDHSKSLQKNLAVILIDRRGIEPNSRAAVNRRIHSR